MTLDQKCIRRNELIKHREAARSELAESQKDELWGSVHREHALIEEIEELSEQIDYLRDSIDDH